MIDKAKADRAVNFIQRLKHTKGRFYGVPFLLEGFQEKIVRDIFGTVKADGTRQYRTVYIELPRKNGKSELGAAIADVLLYADDEMGAEIYGAAAEREQASIVFDVAVQMVRQSPGLSRRSKIVESTKRIIYSDKASFYRVLSAEHATKHGFNAHGVIFDELHVQPNRKLWDVLTSSGGTRSQPMVVALTTAGYDRNSICWEMHKYAEDIISGAKVDPSFYPVIFAADMDDDWTDEAVWHKANPALNTFRSIDEMREKFVMAKNIPAYQNTFRRLYLNQWTSQEERWLDMSAWDECAGEVNEEDLAGSDAYGGLDLASTTDIAAFVLVLPDAAGNMDVIARFFVPQENIDLRELKDSVPYRLWVEQGLIEATPGNVIDYRYIRKRINELGEIYHIKEIAFDRWGATEIIQNLGDDGFEVVQFGQGFKSMAHPTRELLRLAVGGNLRHGGNPVLRWMADNMVVKQDPAGNVKPDKSKSSEKIDGMVALVMGLDRALRHEGGSVYDDRGMLTI